MNHQHHGPAVKALFVNEVDYLAYLGVYTSNIVRYVKNVKNIANEDLAIALNISLEEEEELERTAAPLSEQWRLKLRGFFS